MKKVFSLVLVLIMVLGAVPIFAKDDGGALSETVSWKYCDGILTISGTGEIPDVPDGGYPAWEGYRQDIKKVIVEEGITSIGRNVFQYWIKGVSMYGYGTTLDADVYFIKNAEFEVTLPDSLKEIKYGAFFQRYGLKSIKLPKGIELIESYAFSSTGLTQVYYEGTAEDWAKVQIEDSRMLSEVVSVYVEVDDDTSGDFTYKLADGKVMVKDYTGDEEEVVISDSVDIIANYAFKDYDSFKKIVAGKNVISIQRDAFSHANINELVILNEETKIYASGWDVIYSLGKESTYYLPGSFEECTIGIIYAPVGSYAESYAKENNIAFKPLEEYESTEVEKIAVEPEVQSVHGGIFLRDCFTDCITKIAESNGGIVTVSGDNIAVQKGGKSLAIAGDMVYYMDNGVLVAESLYYSENYMEIPRKALESVLGEYILKSEKYYEVIKRYEEGPIIKSIETWETPYGTLVYYASMGVMHGTGSCLVLVRWDGTELGIVGGNAPKLNAYQNAPWSEVQISEDGRRVKVIYKSNSWLTIDGEIEADLVTGEVSDYKSFLKYP